MMWKTRNDIAVFQIVETSSFKKFKPAFMKSLFFKIKNFKNIKFSLSATNFF